MSYDNFKQSMLSYMRNQRAIGSKEDFAKKLVQEYDGLVHRGYDTINKITVSTGNTGSMETTLVSILNTAFQQSAGEHPLYTNLGPAFQAYWTGATMNLFPAPLPTTIPAPAIHISQVSNSIVNTGTWNGTDIAVIPPEKTKELEDDDFDYESERNSIELANNLPPPLDEEETFQQGNVEFAGYGIDFSGPKEEKKYGEIARGAARSRNAGNTRGTRTGVSSLSDSELFMTAGGGTDYPAMGLPGNFEVETDLGLDQKNYPRYRYKSNVEYQKKYMKSLIYYKNGSDTPTKAIFHVDLVNLIQPAFDEIKSLGLHKYIKQVGGFSVRNVTGGPRLSHHAWGLGMDINASDYPFGTQFSEENRTFYNAGTKKFETGDYTEVDLKFIEAIGIIMKHGGGLLNWLTKFDPMHISLYEGTWGGVPSFAVK